MARNPLRIAGPVSGTVSLEKAQAELLNIAEWMRINKLSLNPTKIEYMILDHPRRRKN